MKPPMEGAWHAHDSAIVSVEYAKHDTGDYVITASTDKTARLWTVKNGQYIGTFGQVGINEQGFKEFKGAMVLF